MRGLKTLVIVMGLLILLASSALVLLIMKRAGNGELVVAAPISLRLAAGEKLLGANSDGKYLTLIISGPNGERIEVRELDSGVVVRKVSVAGGN